MKRNCNIALLLVLFLLPHFCHAQEIPDKVNGWFGAQVRTNISKNVRLGLEIQERIQFDYFHFDEVIMEPKIDLELSKTFRVGARYRLNLENDVKLGNQWGQRAQVYLRYRTKFDDFKLKIKSLLQYELDEFDSPLSDVDNEFVNRSSIHLDYNWFGTKLTPNVGYEIFYHINNLNGGVFYQWRAKVACNYDIKGNFDVDIYYYFDKEFNIRKANNSHIFGLSLNYNL